MAVGNIISGKAASHHKGPRNAAGSLPNGLPRKSYPCSSRLSGNKTVQKQPLYLIVCQPRQVELICHSKGFNYRIPDLSAVFRRLIPMELDIVQTATFSDIPHLLKRLIDKNPDFANPINALWLSPLLLLGQFVVYCR